MHLIKFLAIIAVLTTALFTNPVLINLPANSWYSASNTKMHPLCPGFGYVTPRSCVSVLTAWCSAAYDPIHHKMICFGGGHDDYWGNEVYTFDINSMAWARITDPSPGPYSIDPLADGNPVSRHTYDGLCYLTHANRFFAFGGSRAQDGKGTIAVTWTFDVDSVKWHNMEPTLGEKHGGTASGIHLTMAYHEKTKKIYLQAKDGTTRSYDFDSNTWARVPGGIGAPGGDKTSTIDTKRDLLFTVGDGNWRVFDIMNQRDVTVEWESARPSFFDSIAPGFAYDAKADKIIGWRGGNTVYVLDLDDKAWSTITTSGAPAKANGAGGVYGRFRYVPEYNVFILVNHADSNVAFFKYTSGPGSTRFEGRTTNSGRTGLFAHPNPFNSTVSVKLGGVETGMGRVKAGVSICNAQGRRIESRMVSPEALVTGILWKPTGYPAGIYLFKAEIGDQVFRKRLMLTK